MINRVLPGPAAICPDSKGFFFSGVGRGSLGLTKSLRMITRAMVETKRNAM